MQNVKNEEKDNDYRDQNWRNDQLNYLKRSLELWDENPMTDECLKLTLKWISELENGINPDPWEDGKNFKGEIDRKNYYTCECDEGNKEMYKNAWWREQSKRFTHLKKHRHRIYRTLEQAIEELNNS